MLAVRDLKFATRNAAHGRDPVVVVPRGARLCTVYARVSVVEKVSRASGASGASGAGG